MYLKVNESEYIDRRSSKEVQSRRTETFSPVITELFPFLFLPL